METSVCVEQKGVIEEITGSAVKVRIHREALCGDCSARGMCILSENSEQIIETRSTLSHLQTGDHVAVRITRSMGNKAVLLGYFIPFIILMTSLILLNRNVSNDLITGSLSIGFVLFYYLFLYLFRNQLKRTFNFIISKSA
jgi:sigma-E factor negative regulatory protein RseC